ncbi:MAG: hypothetical protein K6E97_04375 [Treponema sp.]|nr:hypothetical protein [Treponema sp.]
MKKLILLFALLSIFSTQIFCEENHTPKPYSEDEFSQPLKDLRRFEIITFGSIPFITLDATLFYSSYKWISNGFDSRYSPNPFASNQFSKDEITGIILTSVGISIGIGLTDYFINLIKRRKIRKTTIENFDDLTIIELPQQKDEKQPDTDESE